MLLRNPISNTKNFFQKTIKNLKIFLSKTSPYQRLKTTSFDNAEFTQQWDSQKGTRKKKKNRADDQKKSGDCATKQSPNHTVYPEKNGDDNDDGRRDGAVKSKKMTRSNLRHYSLLCSRSWREKRVRLVAQKLKELEIVDKGNVELNLDIQEFIHYYSQLTCPVYLDIVDKFIKQIFAGFFSPQETPMLVMNSNFNTVANSLSQDVHFV